MNHVAVDVIIYLFRETWVSGFKIMLHANVWAVTQSELDDREATQLLWINWMCVEVATTARGPHSAVASDGASPSAYRAREIQTV